MSNVKSDWGFILLCLGLVMLVSYLLASCSSVSCAKKLCCPKPGHGNCPICEYK